MPCRTHKPGDRILLRVLFLSSLTLCLWLSHISSTALQAGLGNVAIAQSPNASQLVQQGVERYQAGDIGGASSNALPYGIAQWQTALSAIQKTNNRQAAAIVLENLARAYQEIGKSDQAISYWTQVIDTYRQLGNRQQVGRMLAEQAQAYSNLGHHRRAIP